MTNGYLIFASVCLALWLTWKWFLREFVANKKKVWLAETIKNFADRLNVVMHAHKTKVFDVLHKMAADLERPLRVLEIGAGSGANFGYLPAKTEITCYEPNDEFEKFILASAGKRPDVRLLGFKFGKAEDMASVETGSQDACICTFVLCSVDDVNQALREIFRILKPGGKLVFIEHIGAESGTMTWLFQHLIHYPWKWAFECDTTRRTNSVIQRFGFSSTDVEIFDAKEIAEGLTFPWSTIVKALQLTVSGSVTK